MKQIKIILVTNIFLIFTLAACTPASESEYQSPERDNFGENEYGNSSTITDEQLPNVLDSYFSARLASDTYTDFSEELIFNTSEISSYRTKTWDAWKTANKNFNEEKLPTLSAISKENTSYWTVKNGLGTADYNMEFAYGYRGTPNPGWTRAIIYLHGSGDDSAEWNGAFTLANSVNNSILFMPRWTTRGDDYNKWYRREKTKLWEKLFRLLMLDENVSPNQIFLTGVSEGGYGTQRMASFYADYLAGAAPGATGEILKNAPLENLANIVYFMQTGNMDTGYDRVYQTKIAEEDFQKLRDAHPNYYRRPYTGGDEYWDDTGGHHIDPITLTSFLNGNSEHDWGSTATDTLTPLLSLGSNGWRKNTNKQTAFPPKYVYWENFDMDGEYRKCFYNLQELESAASPNNRACYEMTVSGNTINLTVRTVSYTRSDRTVKLIEGGYDSNPVEYYTKSYSPATRGKVRIYLHEELVDLTKPVSVTVKGAQTHTYTFTPELSVRHMAESTALFYDPERVFPAAVDVEIR